MSYSLGQHTIKLFIIGFAVLGLFALGFIFINSESHAGTGDNVSGWAWSNNIGWVSFNCTNEGTCGTSDYGVHMDENNGDLSGYAWSNNIGWVSFNRADTGNPPSADPGGGSGPIAQLNLTTLEVEGWARALVHGGGWDGWIRFDHGQSDPVSLNTALSPDEFEGWAWGDVVVGWVSMNCSNEGTCGTVDYSVDFGGTINTPPSVSSPNVDFSASQPGPTCVSREHFSWEFSDAEDGTTQTGYQVQVDDDADFSSPVFDSGSVTASAKERFVTIARPSVDEFADGEADGDGTLAFADDGAPTYNWRVRVRDSAGAFSPWVEGPDFNTSLHPYPQVDFSWAPENPSEGERTIFNDTTTWDTSNRSWSWFHQDANYVDGTTSSSENPHVEFTSDGAKDVSLTATDGDLAADVNSGAGQCRKDDVVDAQQPLPDFRETPPITLLDKISNNLMAFVRKPLK